MMIGDNGSDNSSVTILHTTEAITILYTREIIATNGRILGPNLKYKVQCNTKCMHA